MFQFQTLMIMLVVKSYTYLIFKRSQEVENRSSGAGGRRCEALELRKHGTSSRKDSLVGQTNEAKLESYLDGCIQSKNFNRAIKLLYVYSYFFHASVALKYIFLIWLDSGWLKEQAYISCILIGRFTLNPRVIKMVRVDTAIVSTFHLIWRIVMISLKPEFHFDVIRFLLLRDGEVLKWDTRAREALRLEQVCSGGTLDVQDGMELVDRKACNKNSYKSSVEHSALLHYECNLDEAGLQRAYRLRPNRTLEARDYLRAVTKSYFLPSLVVSSLMVPLWVVSMYSVLLTKRGFELNYQHCVEWIGRQTNKGDYSTIYEARANISVDFSFNGPILPFENFTDFTKPYQLARLGIDSGESLLVLMELVFAFSINPCFAILIAHDIELYVQFIREKLGKFIKESYKFSNGIQEGNNKHRFESPMLRRIRLKELSLLSGQAGDIQAMLVDLMGQIEAANKYVAFFSVHTIFLWLVYSSTGFSWLVIPGNIFDSSKFEWSLIQLLSTAYVLIVVGAFAQARSSVRSIYSLAASAAAIEGQQCFSLLGQQRNRQLDQAGRHQDQCTTWLLRRRRWLSILRYYTPLPLYCFTAYGRIEISWFFLVKLMLWLFSALFVASSYLTYY